MRDSEPIASTNELEKEHEAAREGLPPAHQSDLDNWHGMLMAERDKRQAERQKLYDRKQV